jgi:hypothetical protein
MRVTSLRVITKILKSTKLTKHEIPISFVAFVVFARFVIARGAVQGEWQSAFTLDAGAAPR